MNRTTKFHTIAFDSTGAHPYHCAAMPGPPSVQVLPRSVNPRKFAYQDTYLQGKVMSSTLERLQGAVVAVQDDIDVDLHFYLDEEGKPVVSGVATANVVLTCQRCLENLQQVIQADIQLALVLNEKQSRQLEKQYDPWLIDSEDGSANLHTMVEDELLLALPMVAMHPEFCIDESLLHSGAVAGESVAGLEQDNPFSVLKQLQSKTSKSD